MNNYDAIEAQWSAKDMRDYPHLLEFVQSLIVDEEVK
jgi:hypothetical protein